MAAPASLAWCLRLFCRRLRLPHKKIMLDANRRWIFAPANSRQLCLTSSALMHTGRICCALPSTITVTNEPDTLYQKVEVLVKCHDKAVLDSYEFFTTMAARELGVTVGKVYEPAKKIERLTVLKSVHIHKKHRVQYEMRTHYRCIEFFRLTGSTAQVFLEYIQRNLPEGVAMEVTRTAIEKIPEHILEPLWNSTPEKEQKDQ